MKILLTHSPEALANYYGERALKSLHADEAALAARPDVIATPHTAGLTRPAIEHQSMETVAQAAAIVKGRAPKGALNAKHWRRKP